MGYGLKPTHAVYSSIVAIVGAEMAVIANIFLLIIALKKLKAERKLHPAVIPAIATRNDQQTPEEARLSPSSPCKRTRWTIASVNASGRFLLLSRVVSWRQSPAISLSWQALRNPFGRTLQWIWPQRSVPGGRESSSSWPIGSSVMQLGVNLTGSKNYLQHWTWEWMYHQKFVEDPWVFFPFLTAATICHKLYFVQSVGLC